MNVLLFTSQEVLLSALEFRFRKQGWALAVASRYPAGKELIKKKKPAFIVVDLSLPDYHGLDVIQFVGYDFPTDPPCILVMASLESPDLILESLRLGAADFVTAPCKPDELILRIKRLIGANPKEAA